MPVFTRGGVLLFLISAMACGGASPTTPTATPPPSVPGGQVTAVLAVSTFTVTRHPTSSATSDWVDYDVKVKLSEVGGNSGALLQSVALSSPSMGTDYGCSGSQIPKINPGGTWDMDSWGYCAPGVYIPKSVANEPATVTLSVRFVDNDGRAGSLSSTAMTREP
jgi:hypothetical protein